MARTAEELLEDARRQIGVETPLTKGRYPVEYDPIRRTCHMVGDQNPLFLDLEYAKDTRYGAVICPPSMVSYFSGPGAWPPGGEPPFPPVPTPGDRVINLRVEAEWFRPVKVGDQLFQRIRIADVYIKPIRLDPEAFWILRERIISNQRGEVVCVERNLLAKHRTPAQVAAAGDSSSPC